MHRRYGSGVITGRGCLQTHSERLASPDGQPYDVRMKQFCTCFVILLVCLAELRFARADAIIVSKAMTASTIAELFIEDGVIRVELEIGVKDLNALRNLLPDELYEGLGHAPQPFPEPSSGRRSPS